MTCGEFIEALPLYLSGELDDPAFDAHLLACPACSREVVRQKELDAKLRASVLAKPVESTAIENRARREIRAGGFRRWAAAAAVVLAAGLAGYVGLRATRLPKVCTDAALDHRLEVVEHQRRPWMTDPSAVASLAASRGLPSAAMDAVKAAGYRFERGKLCRLDGRAFLHVIYTDGSREISLFVGPKSAKDAVRSRDLGQQKVASFESNAWTAVAVSDSETVAANLGRIASAAL